MPLLEGIAAALVTPLTDDGKAVKTAVVADLVEFHLKSGLSYFYVCGNTGEGFVLSKEERKTMAEAVVKAVGGRAPVIVMIAAASLEDSIELAKHSKEIGASGISSVVPFDKPNNLGAAVEFWTAIGGATDLPLYIYWIAKTADKSITANQFLEAIKPVPHFAGLKFTDTNFFMFQQLKFLGGETLNAVTGPDEMMVAGLAMGSDGAIGSTYNIYPKLAASLYTAFRAGDIKTAMKVQEQMNQVITILMESCDVRARGTNIISPLKALLKEKHGIDVGPSRETWSTHLTAEQHSSLLAKIGALDFEVA